MKKYCTPKITDVEIRSIENIAAQSLCHIGACHKDINGDGILEDFWIGNTGS